MPSSKPTITFTRVASSGRARWTELTMDTDGLSFGDTLLRVIEQADEGVLRTPYPEPETPNRHKIILSQTADDKAVARRIMRTVREYYELAPDAVTVIYPDQGEPVS